MRRLLTASPAVLAIATGAAVLAGSATALAAWVVTSEPTTLSTTAVTLSPGNRPEVTVAGGTVTVRWAPSQIVAGHDVSGYRITRYDRTGGAQPARGVCEEIVTGSNCTDAAVPPGTWTYTVRPVQANWTGPESGRSHPVTIAAPGPDGGPGPSPVPVPSGPPAPPPARYGTVLVDGRGVPAIGPDAPSWTVEWPASPNAATTLVVVYPGRPDPGSVFEGWDGRQRPVSVVADPAGPTLTVYPPGRSAPHTPALGPFTVGAAGQLTAADSAAGTIALAGDRYVVTIGGPTATARPATPPPTGSAGPTARATPAPPVRTPKPVPDLPTTLAPTGVGGPESRPTEAAAVPPYVPAPSASRSP
ncbi:hypothetical protein [Polymorphospora rubra]|uniref:Fibronectin type-III domain-containing protein n=1 Tax=Polymorphospora rubra TaxID=338584 RepID=A0A810N1E0_9ACTN|nr:hypothetical protein [Polymorphospora rubra]BCJ66464.1 hypothetical protein Prubr_34850 [Polymorphospora rubra]